MSDKRHVEIVNELTTKAEKGESIADTLNQIPYQERLDLAKQIQKTNEQHRSKDDTLPSLDLVTAEDSAGKPHLKDIKTSDGKHSYNLPKAAEGDWRDYILFDRVYDATMDRDTQDSKHLQSLSVLEKSGKFYDGTGSRNQ
ncbi:MAG: hypothetical protein K2X81_22125 [Candidatus Obscuribacterales bacterium]|nr:hypothetical protein [Candidatus Obscuribacterales bacterium]